MSKGVGWFGRRHLPLMAIFLAYLFIGALFARETPPWQAPDEPAHYNVVRQLAAGRLPVIAPPDYDETYRAQAVSDKFGPDYPVEPLTYEDWQPPLYYLLLTPIFMLSGGALLPLRLASLSLGLGVLLATYAIACKLWPGRRWQALTATAFVAFLPQHIAILSSVNNDSLSELIIALQLWLLAVVTTRDREDAPISTTHWTGLGFLLGLGFLTKLTAYMMVPVILFTLLRLYRRKRSNIWRAAARVFIPATLLGALLWARNMIVYGLLDPLGIMAHDAVVLGQPRTSEWVATYGVAETLERFVTTTFRSFWGQFGWMGVLMDARIYRLLLLFSLIVLAALLWQRLTQDRSLSAQAGHGKAIALRHILLVTFVMNVILYIGYNVTYVQHQGRYLYGALIPIALAVSAGISVWTKPFTRRWPQAAALTPALFATALIGLDLIALYYFIIPQLARS